MSDFYDEDDNYYNNDVRYYSRVIKRYAEIGVHYPNKQESKLLRKLMSQTGLNEIQLREHKKYRIMLSMAQKKNGKKNRLERKGIFILKLLLRELKLPKEHPNVLKILRERLKESYYHFSIFNYSAEHIIKIYKNK